MSECVCLGLFQLANLQIHKHKHVDTHPQSHQALTTIANLPIVKILKAIAQS